jgi:hypothetical protein
MNFTTHVMFGLLIGTLFFGPRPEIVLLVGVGSAIPDLDREYAFFSRDKYRDSQLHRALCHNYFFMGLLFLVSPFIALGAFLHTVLDALTTAKDRGVEWLFPFSRVVKVAANDEKGNQFPGINPKKVYFYQNDPIELTRKSDKDLAERKPAPWRRTYGPALSGGLLDQGIFFGSLVLFILYAVFTYSQTGHILAQGFTRNFEIPFVIGAIGIAMNMAAGEIDRRKEIKKPGYERPPRIYETVFGASLGLMLFSIALAAYLNASLVERLYTPVLPYIFIGAVIVCAISVTLVKAYSIGPFVRLRHHSEAKKGDDSSIEKSEDEPVIV